MSATAVTLLVLTGSFALWVLLGVFKAIRDVLAERAAGWLLPAGQPITFRIALFLAILARTLAPSRVAKFRSLLDPQFIYVRLLFPVDWTHHGWSEPESAIAELEADLRAERRVLDPVRFVIPLWPTVFALHWRNIRQLTLAVLWIPIGALLFVLAHFIGPVENAIASLRRVRRLRRRKRSP